MPFFSKGILQPMGTGRDLAPARVGRITGIAHNGLRSSSSWIRRPTRACPSNGEGPTSAGATCGRPFRGSGSRRRR